MRTRYPPVKTLIVLAALIIIFVSFPACSSQQPAGPENKTWLSPGKVSINNLSAGRSVKQKIRIHNGGKNGDVFALYYRTPDYVEKGFTAAPEEARHWITFGNESPRAGPGETQEIEITLALPTGAETPERWEFWLAAREKKTDSLNMELCSRWLITMR
jgi:hypothetical protein